MSWKIKPVYVFTFVFLLLFIVGVAAVRIIFERIEQLTHHNETSAAVERALFTQRDFDLLSQRLDTFLKASASDTGWRQHTYLDHDSILQEILHFGALDIDATADRKLVLLPTQQRDSIQRLQLYIDLDQLNHYLQYVNPYASAYASVYTSDGICLVHPDSSLLGSMASDEKLWMENAQGIVQHSGYLDLPVRQFVYPLKHFFLEAYIVISVPMIGLEKEIEDVLYLSLVLGAALLLTVTAFSVSLYMQRKKEHGLALEHANMEKEQALARFERLREQMNPHFLFNALGSLQQLVKKDQERAQLFVGKMAKMYRSMLRQDTRVYTSLEEEVSLATAYLFLQEVRFRNCFSPIDIQVDEDYMPRLLPRWSLQIVVENAIKHNTFTTSEPLSIQFAVDGERLVVRNNYSPKNYADMESLGYGLKYIQSVYQAEGTKGFEYGAEGNYFTVYLPFLG